MALSQLSACKGTPSEHRQVPAAGLQKVTERKGFGFGQTRPPTCLEPRAEPGMGRSMCSSQTTDVNPNAVMQGNWKLCWQCSTSIPFFNHYHGAAVHALSSLLETPARQEEVSSAPVWVFLFFGIPPLVFVSSVSACGNFNCGFRKNRHNRIGVPNVLNKPASVCAEKCVCVCVGQGSVCQPRKQNWSTAG